MMVLRIQLVRKGCACPLWRLFYTRPGLCKRTSVAGRVAGFSFNFRHSARLKFSRLWSSTRCNHGVETDSLRRPSLEADALGPASPSWAYTLQGRIYDDDGAGTHG